jgi:hypothetical protein
MQTQATTRREVIAARAGLVLQVVESVHQRGQTIHKTNLMHYVCPEHAYNYVALSQDWNEYVRPIVDALPSHLRETVRTKARVGALKAGQPFPKDVADVLASLVAPTVKMSAVSEADVEGKILRNPEAFIDKMNAAIFIDWLKRLKNRHKGYVASLAAQQANVAKLIAELQEAAA